MVLGTNMEKEEGIKGLYVKSGTVRNGIQNHCMVTVSMLNPWKTYNTIFFRYKFTQDIWCIPNSPNLNFLRTRSTTVAKLNRPHLEEEQSTSLPINSPPLRGLFPDKNFFFLPGPQTWNEGGSSSFPPRKLWPFFPAGKARMREETKEPFPLPSTCALRSTRPVPSNLSWQTIPTFFNRPLCRSRGPFFTSVAFRVLRSSFH